jgi:regulator of sirC expression with transglutaminase-like and TPR domain
MEPDRSHPDPSPDPSPDAAAQRPARRALARLLALPDERIPLAEAALLIAQEEYPDLDVPQYLQRLHAMGEQLGRDLAVYAETDGSSPDGFTRADRLRALRNYLYGEFGFKGTSDDSFFDPRNSLLNEVLDRRTGLPILLALVFIEVGRAIGLELAGVSFPGNFLVKTMDGGPELLLDPFQRGREVTWVEAIDRIEKLRGKKEPPEEYTDAVTPRRFLFRLLANLKLCYMRDDRFPEAIATVDRMLLVHPGAHWERRDRGLLAMKLGWYHRARTDLERYVEAVPQAKDRELIERRIEEARELGARLN